MAPFPAGRRCAKPGCRRDSSALCLWLSGPVLLHSISCGALAGSLWSPCPGPGCLSVLHPSPGMLPFRMNHILCYLAWGARWKGTGRHVGWRRWRPAVNEARRKCLCRRAPAPQDCGKGGRVCWQAVKALSASMGRPLTQWACGWVQQFLEKRRRGGAPARLLLKLPRGLGVPLPSGSAVPSVAQPCCPLHSKAPRMELSEPWGWQLLASPWVQGSPAHGYGVPPREICSPDLLLQAASSNLHPVQDA